MARRAGAEDLGGSIGRPSGLSDPTPRILPVLNMDHLAHHARRQRADVLDRVVLPHLDHALALIEDRQPDLLSDSLAAAQAVRSFVAEPTFAQEVQAAQVGTRLSDDLGFRRVEPGQPRYSIDAVAYSAASLLSNCSLYAWESGEMVGWARTEFAAHVQREVTFLAQYGVPARR